MKGGEEPRAALLLSVLAVGLMFDPAGFLRMTLACSATHEAGHALAFRLCAGRWPHVRVAVGGAALGGAQSLSRGRLTAVLCAGPAANFLLAGALLLRAAQKASYGAYFLAAVSLCVGLYNLLPLGALDGARLIETWLPARACGAWARAQRLLVGLAGVAGAAGCAALPLPSAAKCAALLAPVYLLVQQHGAGGLQNCEKSGTILH